MKNFFMKIKDNVTNDIRTVKALKGVSSKKKTQVYIKWGLLLLLILLLIFLPIGCSSCGRKSDKNKIEDSTETQIETESETETESESETETETESQTKPGSNNPTKKPVKKPEPESVPSSKPSNVLPGDKKPEKETEVLPTDKPQVEEETTKGNDDNTSNPTNPGETETEKETDPIIIVKPIVPSSGDDSEKTTISDDMENPYEEMETVNPFPVETQPQPIEPSEPETQPENVSVQFKRVDGAGIINACINPSGIGRNVRGYWVYVDGSTCAAESTTNGYRIIYKFGIDYEAVKLVIVVDNEKFSYNLN